MTEQVDEIHVVDEIYLDFSMTFDMVPDSIYIWKLIKYGLEIRWVTILLDH